MAKHEKQGEEPHSYQFIDEQLHHETAEEGFLLEEFDLAEEGNERPLAYIEEGLKREIIGQPAALESLVTALYREDFRNPNRPITVLMLLGQTGTGKSETAKVLSRLLHGNEDALMAINCSEISENHRVSALLGASPEYVGREQAPMLDRKKIERPRSVVLFDEVEKGAPALHNLLLQICDEGELTLLKDGKKVSFRNSIVIMTSNIGVTEGNKTTNPAGFQPNQLDKTTENKRYQEAVINALITKSGLRPELIGRINEAIVFQKMEDEQLEQILEHYIDKTNATSYHDKGFHITLSPELRRELVMSCDKGKEDRNQFGARPIIKKYEKLIEGLVARLIATGSIPTGSHIHTVVTEDGNSGIPLQDRIKVYHKQSAIFTGSVALPRKGNHGQLVKEKETDTSTTINNRTAIGLAAAAGIAALLIGDYMTSRRAHRA